MKVPFSAACLIFLVSSFAFATGPLHRSQITKEAEIVSVRGEGWVRFVRETDWKTVFFEQVLTAGDFVKTGTNGKLDILFNDGTQIKVHNRTVRSRGSALAAACIDRCKASRRADRRRSAPENARK